VPTIAPDEVAGNSVMEVFPYTCRDAARYLRLPLWGVYGLTGRIRNDSNREDDREPLSFPTLATVFVRAASLPLFQDPSANGTAWRAEWEMYAGMVQAFQELPPFDDTPAEMRVDAFIRPYEGRIGADQLNRLRDEFARRIERVEAAGGGAVRLFPFSRDPAESSPRIVVIDPRVRFGRPTVSGSGIPTDILFERHQAGDSVADLVADYDLTAEEVEEAIRYETPTVPHFLPNPDRLERPR